jgi:putative transposase
MLNGAARQQNASTQRFDRTVCYDWVAQILFETIKAVQVFTTSWLWTNNHERPKIALEGIAQVMRLTCAAWFPLLAPTLNGGIS